MKGKYLITTELQIFLNLLKQNEFICKYGEKTRMVVEIHIESICCQLYIYYGSLNTRYTIKYKGVLISEEKIYDEKYIDNYVYNIIKEKEENIKKEYYNML